MDDRNDQYTLVWEGIDTYEGDKAETRRGLIELVEASAERTNPEHLAGLAQCFDSLSAEARELVVVLLETPGEILALLPGPPHKRALLAYAMEYFKRVGKRKSQRKVNELFCEVKQKFFDA